MTEPKKSRPLHGILQRLPALVGVVMGFVTGGEEVNPLPIVLIVVSLYYLVSGLVRKKDLPTPKALGAHVSIALGFVLLGLITLSASGPLSYYLMAAAWLLHAAWDLYLFRKNIAVHRWITEFCIVYDVILATLLVIVAARP